MNCLGKFFVAGVATMAAMIPLVASAPVEAGPGRTHYHAGRGHYRGREHHRGAHRYGRPRYVYYRSGPDRPWVLYGTWNDDLAARAAQYLQSQGYQVFSR